MWHLICDTLHVTHDKAKVSPLSWRAILYMVFICIFWVFRDIILGKARKSMLVERNMDCLMIQNASFKVQKCFFFKLAAAVFCIKNLASVMLPVLAFEYKKIYIFFWFMRHKFWPKIAYSGTCWIQWFWSIKTLELTCFVYIWLVWHMLIFLIQYD